MGLVSVTGFKVKDLVTNTPVHMRESLIGIDVGNVCVKKQLCTMFSLDLNE
jgi:hypothetical protein